jgi:ribonucleotide monophosphatase NagD (HAD superfamily)
MKRLRLWIADRFACGHPPRGKVPVVLGNPDPSMLVDLCRALAVTPRQIAMVGDRIYTDMAMEQPERWASWCSVATRRRRMRQQLNPGRI